MLTILIFKIEDAALTIVVEVLEAFAHKSPQCARLTTDSTGLRKNFTMDGRFNWPSQIFTEVCKCKDNYGGFNCSECKFGYKGDDCSTKTVRVRRSITDADFNWTNYREQLNRSKTEIQKRYKVYIGGNVTNETNYKEVTLYNLFAWMHHYVAWTAEEKYNPSESGKSQLDTHTAKCKVHTACHELYIQLV